MSTKNKNYLEFPISFIEQSGLSPNSKFLRKLISIGIFFPMTLILIYLICRKFYDTEINILIIAEIFEALTTCAHLLLRKYTMLVHGELIQEIIRDRAEQFWDYNLFGGEFGKNLQQQMSICLKIVKIVVTGGLITIGLFCVTTVFDEKKVVPLMCWIPENKVIIGIIYCCQILIMIRLMYILLGLDCFYLLVSTDLKIQFILLRKMIKTLNFDILYERKSLKRLVHCTQHHEFLLRFHGKINTVFSVYFIVLYIITAASASIHAYIVMFRSPSFSDSVKSLCYLSGMLFQVGLFFIITSNVEIEAENLCDEIYDINWEITDNLKIRRHVMFMLMKSQKPVSIMGGGTLHINRNEYVVLCRLAYSIATILGGMT